MNKAKYYISAPQSSKCLGKQPHVFPEVANPFPQNSHIYLGAAFSMLVNSPLSCNLSSSVKPPIYRPKIKIAGTVDLPVARCYACAK